MLHVHVDLTQPWLTMLNHDRLAFYSFVSNQSAVLTRLWLIDWHSAARMWPTLNVAMFNKIIKNISVYNFFFVIMN